MERVGVLAAFVLAAATLSVPTRSQPSSPIVIGKLGGGLFSIVYARVH